MKVKEEAIQWFIDITKIHWSENHNYIKSKLKTLTYKRINGESFISSLMDIPDNIIYDYMHLCCLGTLEHNLNLWLFNRQDNIIK